MSRWAIIVIVVRWRTRLLAKQPLAKSALITVTLGLKRSLFQQLWMIATFVKMLQAWLVHKSFVLTGQSPGNSSVLVTQLRQSVGVITVKFLVQKNLVGVKALAPLQRAAILMEMGASSVTA